MSSHYTCMPGIRKIDSGIDEIIIIFNLTPDIHFERKPWRGAFYLSFMLEL